LQTDEQLNLLTSATLRRRVVPANGSQYSPPADGIWLSEDATVTITLANEAAPLDISLAGLVWHPMCIKTFGAIVSPPAATCQLGWYRLKNCEKRKFKNVRRKETSKKSQSSS
jgi:hypothetical protein